MDERALTVDTLRTAGEMAAVVAVFGHVWGSANPVVSVELLRAISHGGGYVSAASDGDHVVGASFGFLARHRGDEALHSHVTAVLPGVQHQGVGRALKLHQRTWAAERSIPWIVWTFDPVVRRNAWFNIAVLGAHVTDYVENFYGAMTDSINADDESDRLVVAWPSDPTVQSPGDVSAGATVEVPTPADIVGLRRTDPAATRSWRLRLRDELGGRLADGATVTGFTKNGSYRLVVPATNSPGDRHAPD